MGPWTARTLRLLSPVLPALLAGRPGRSPRRARRDVESASAGKTYRSRVWAHGEDRQGQSVAAHFETGEAYAFAARAAIHAVEAVLAEPRPGAWTPGAAFGRAFLPGIAGGRIVDDDPVPIAQLSHTDPLA